MAIKGLGSTGGMLSGGTSLGNWDAVGKKADSILVPGVQKAKDKKEEKKKAAAEAAIEKTRPVMPDYKSALDENGNLAKQYRIDPNNAVGVGAVQAKKLGDAVLAKYKVNAPGVDLKALAADSRAQDAMRERAMAKGDSPWLKMQLEKLGLEELSARDAAARQATSGAAMARSQLAMKGGLGGGASSRIAMQSMRDMNAARQGIGRDAAMNRLQLGIADDQTRQGLLASVAGLDLSRAAQTQDLAKFNSAQTYDADKWTAAAGLDIAKFDSAQAYDAEKTTKGHILDAQKFKSAQAYDAEKATKLATLGQIYGETQFDTYKYGEDMKGYAAGKQANAIANSGKGNWWE
jgi:hypothetical protein